MRAEAGPSPDGANSLLLQRTQSIATAAVTAVGESTVTAASVTAQVQLAFALSPFLPLPLLPRLLSLTHSSFARPPPLALGPRIDPHHHTRWSCPPPVQASPPLGQPPTPPQLEAAAHPLVQCRPSWRTTTRPCRLYLGYAMVVPWKAQSQK